MLLIAANLFYNKTEYENSSRTRKLCPKEN